MRRSYSYVTLVLFVGLLIAGTIGQAFADGPDFYMCKGQVGAALGLCRAAISAGCGEDAANPGCQSIVDGYIEITGEDPPWLPPCPCGAAKEWISYIPDESNPVCNDGYPVFLAIDTLDPSYKPSVVFSFYPYQPPYDDSGAIKQTCGWNNTSIYELTDLQAQSCINELRKILEYLELECQ